MNKVTKWDVLIVLGVGLLVVILGACTKQPIPAGDFCDVYTEPVIFVSDQGVAEAIRNKSNLLDRSGITRILTANTYQAENCGE